MHNYAILTLYHSLLAVLLDPVVNLEIVTKKRFLVYLLSLGHSYQDYTGCLEMQSGQKFLSAIFKMAAMNYRKCYKISFRANIYEHMVSIYIYIVTKHALSQKRNFWPGSHFDFFFRNGRHLTKILTFS